MNTNNYIGEYEAIKTKQGEYLKVKLLGSINKCGTIKPRFSVKVNDFTKFEKRYLPARDFGFLIISTNKGLITHDIAIEKKIGGTLIAYCY